MNELRWILLIAGALLIAGIYYWGVRSRSRGGTEAGGRRANVFDTRPAAIQRTVDDRGFDDVADDDDFPAHDEQADPEAFPAREVRRVEPSISFDDDDERLETPAIERRSQFEHRPIEEPAEPGPPARREPTIGRRVEPASQPARSEPMLHGRSAPEPMLYARSAPEPVVPFEPEPLKARPDPAAPAIDQGPAAAAAKPRKAAQKIFAVRVGAPGAAGIPGQQLLDALRTEGLAFGRYDIFHRLHGDGRPVFSVASLRDPGTFQVASMPSTHFPGVLVFTVLPGPVSASEAFDEMLFTARALASHLGGALADDKGVPLTALRAGRLRDEALEFERTAGVA